MDDYDFDDFEVREKGDGSQYVCYRGVALGRYKAFTFSADAINADPDIQRILDSWTQKKIDAHQAENRRRQFAEHKAAREALGLPPLDRE